MYSIYSILHFIKREFFFFFWSVLSNILCHHYVWTTPLDYINFSFLDYFAWVNRPRVYCRMGIVMLELIVPSLPFPYLLSFAFMLLLRVSSFSAMLVLKLQFFFDSFISWVSNLQLIAKWYRCKPIIWLVFSFLKWAFMTFKLCSYNNHMVSLLHSVQQLTFLVLYNHLQTPWKQTSHSDMHGLSQYDCLFLGWRSSVVSSLMIFLSCIQLAHMIKHNLNSPLLWFLFMLLPLPEFRTTNMCKLLRPRLPWSLLHILSHTILITILWSRSKLCPLYS